MKIKKCLNNALFIIFLIIIIPILVISTTILVKSIIKPNEIPSFLGYKPMIVLSGSMERELYAGDVAIVKVIDYDLLQKGDVIAFRTKDNTVITHRIVDILDEENKKIYKTMGDSNDVEDNEIITKENIEGKYVYKIVSLGAFLMWLQKPMGLLVCILTILLIGGGYFFIKNQKELKEFKKKNSK